MEIEENIKKLEKKVEKQSFAMELLEFSKEQNRHLEKINKRLIIVLIIILVLWFATIGYLVYILNDLSSVETTEISQDNENGYNNYIGNDGDITNGKASN